MFKCTGLQLPEDLTLFATTLADSVETFKEADTGIMVDVTYVVLGNIFFVFLSYLR